MAVERPRKSPIPKLRRRLTIQQHAALDAPDHDYADIIALKAVAAGTANAEQQQRFFGWLVKKACTIGGISFTPDKPDVGDFKEGRRFIGAWLVYFLEESGDSLIKRFQDRKPLEPKPAREPKDDPAN